MTKKEPAQTTQAQSRSLDGLRTFQVVCEGTWSACVCSDRSVDNLFNNFSVVYEENPQKIKIYSVQNWLHVSFMPKVSWEIHK